MLADLGDRMGRLGGFRRPRRYGGARPFRAFKANTSDDFLVGAKGFHFCATALGFGEEISELQQVNNILEK